MSGMKDTLGDTPYNDLFAYTRTRRTDPQTSVKAAASVFDKINATQRAVYEAFKAIAPRGMTQLDVQYKFNNHRSTFRTRVSELGKLGLLRDSGGRVVQEGRERIVWVLNSD